MKKYIIVLIIFKVCFVNAQDTLQGYIKYNVVRNYFHEMPNGKKELYDTKKLVATLFYKGQETLYKEITTTGLSDMEEKQLSNNTITILPGNVDAIQSIVYKDYQKNIIYYSFSPIQGRLGIFIQDTIRSMVWESTTEEKIINGRKCTKFRLPKFFNTEWTAWVDLDVAFNEGPWRFINLPGLIVELVADNGTQTYQLQEINMGSKILNEKLYPNELKTVKVYSKQEYEKIQKEKQERIRLILEQNNKSNN